MIGGARLSYLSCKNCEKDTKYEGEPLKVEDALAPNCFDIMAKVPAVPSPVFRRAPLLFYISRHRARQLEITEIIPAFKSGTTVRDVAKL